MARTKGTDDSVLAAALIGYQAQRQAIIAKIQEIKAQLGKNGARKAPMAAAVAVPRKHRISPEGIKRIREAQKRRWAAARQANAATA